MTTVSHASPIPSTAMQRLTTFLAQREAARGEGMPFSEFEREVHERVAAVEREAVAAELARRDVDAPEVFIDGVRHRRVLRSEAPYITLAGEVRVMRTLFAHRSADSRSICAVDVRAGIVEGYWTPAAARLAVWSVAHLTPGEAETMFEMAGGMAPSRSSLDRLPKALSDRWEESRPEFEAAVRTQEALPAGAVTVAVSLDGVLTPMKDGKRGEKRAASEEAGRQASGPAGYQEVGCGTVSLYNADGERLSTVYMSRMPESRKATLKEELVDEIAHLLRLSPSLTLVKVADGAKDNWTFLTKLPGRNNEVLDFYHAAEHLGRAIDAAFGEGTAEARDYAHKLRERLLEDDGVERVIRALRYLRKTHPRAKSIERELAFFRNNRHRMQYAEMRAKNLPIGSGVVEAACKTVVGQRLKRSGMRWRSPGGQAILTFRSLALSGRFDRAWRLLEAGYLAEVRSANNARSYDVAADGKRASA